MRSIRPMDPDIATPLGGIIAYSGGQQYFVDLMKATPLVNIVFDEDDTAVRTRRRRARSARRDPRRDRGRRRERLDLPPPAVQFAYGTADPLAAPGSRRPPTSHIELVFSEGRSPSWEWDPTAYAWLRSQEGTARPRGVGGADPRDERGDDARRHRLALRGGAADRDDRLRGGVGLGGRQDRARHLVEGCRRMRRSCSRPTTAVRSGSLRATRGSNWCRTRARRRSRPERCVARIRGIARLHSCRSSARIVLALTRFEC